MNLPFSLRAVSPGIGFSICLLLALILPTTDVWAEEEVTDPGACCLSDLSCRLLLPQACDLLGGYFLGEGSSCESNPCQEAPTCLLSPTSIDFGPVGVSQSRDTNFRITNAGGSFLEGAISEACIEYSIVGNRNYALGPRESKIFTVRFAPRKEGPSSCGFFLGGDCPELVVIGTGESAPRCDVSPIALDFGPVTVDEERDLSFVVTNDGGGFLTGNVVVQCQDFFLAGTGGYNLAGGQSREFVLRFLPVVVGERSCLIEIDGCEPLLATAIGEPAPICIFDPNPVLFDTTFVGESSAQEFYLTNGGGGVLEGELDLSCQDYRLLGNTTYQLAPGDTAFYSLVFEPEQLGGQLCEIQAEAPCNVLSAVGHGAASPFCVLSAQEVDYGTVYVGESAVRELRITNEGESSLEGALQLDCAAFTLLGSSGYNLAAGESAVFRVEFTPRSLGTDRCTVNVGERCEDVSLLGTGEEPPVCAVVPQWISFGEIPLQTVVRDSVVVTNLGDGLLTGEALLTCRDSGMTLTGATSYSLGAGQSQTLWIEYQPTGPGEVDCALVISDRCPPVPILATGIEVPECEIVPSLVSFGAVPMGTSVDTLIMVTNTGSGVLTGQPLAACEGFSLVGPTEFELAAGEFEVYQLRFAPTGEEPTQCEVSFGDSCGVWIADGAGLGPICGVDPTALDFGVVIPGKIEERSVIVSNLGGGVLVGALSWDCAAYTIDGLTSGATIAYDLGTGESDTLLVQFAPMAPSTDNCTVLLGTEDPNCQSLELLGSGGEASRCDLTPAKIEMVIEQGVVTVATAVVTNRGQGRLIGTITTDCELLQILSPTEFSLTENESARIEFSANTTTVGSFECAIDLGIDCAPLVVDVSVVPRRGACCLLDGSCRVLNEAGCGEIQGTSWDPETRCESNVCQPHGACCLIDGGCRLGPAAACPPAVGTYLGDGLPCDPDPCPTAGACCLQSGECVITTSDRCDDQLGLWSANPDCTPAQCAPLGACCLIGESCIFVEQAACDDTDGFFLGAGTTCLPFPCDPPGACCSAQGECRLVPQAVCQAELGVLWTEGVSCSDITCDPRGACCLDNGDCVLSTEVTCPGRYLGDGEICSVSACRRVGACCDPQGVCTIALETTCTGTFFATRTDCDPSPCHSRIESVQVIQSESQTLFTVDTDDPRIEDLQGWVRRGGELEFSKVQNFTQEDRQWSSTIASHDYTIRGVEYFLQYVDVQLGLIVFHGSADRPRRIVLNEDVPAPSAQAKRFLFLSPPAEIQASSLGTWLRDQFGPAGRTSWRLGWWDPLAERYLEHADDLPLPDAVGRGYWLAFAEDTDWVFPASTRYPGVDQETYRIALSPGWNMIGNPAAYPIGVDSEEALIEDGDRLLSLAAARPQRVGELLVLESGTSTPGPLSPYRNERVSLDVWEGGWIENRTDHEVTLLLPALEATGTRNRNSTRSLKEDSDLRVLELLATAGGESAGIDLLLHPEATVELDSWDLAAPPGGPDRTLKLQWMTPDRYLLRQALPDFEVAPPEFRVVAETAITLSWNILDGTDLELVSLGGTAPTIDLQGVRSVGLPLGVHKFRLVARSSPETPPVLASGRISIEPNPVRSSTRILLELQRPEAVRIDLFDPAGKRVWSEDRGILASGRHIFVWDGRGEDQIPLPAGTYFVSALLGRERYTEKLVLIR